MKNFLISVTLIATSSAALQLFMPWWIIAVVAFLVAYFLKQNALAAFGSGFLGVFLLWMLCAFLLSAANDNLLASKVAMLLPLKGSVKALLLVTGLVGGLVSGFAAITGSLAIKLND